MKKFLGFTLAEVLITIAILGVVATLTMPTLMTNYNRHVVEVRLQDTYSTILQAMKMYAGLYGDGTVSLDDGADEDGDGNSYSWARSKQVFDEVFEPVFMGDAYPQGKEFNVYSQDGSTLLNSGVTNTVYYSLNNGTVLGFTRGGNYDSLQFRIILNPKKKQLIAGRDAFFFNFQNDGTDNYSYRQVFDDQYDNDREKLITYCSSNERVVANYSDALPFCTHLIFLNGFKIPEDYPVRL